MPELRPLDDVKARLLARWDRAVETPAETEGVARFETAPGNSLPRGGLAIGESINARGEPRIELRVTATRGPSYRLAQKLEREAKDQGYDARLRAVGNAVFGQPSRTPPVFGCRSSPLHLGASIAHFEGTAGSVGGFVSLQGGDVGVLSCAHVLAMAQGVRCNIGDDVVQPGPWDKGLVVLGKKATDRVGELAVFAPFIFRQAQNLDAAIATLDGPIAHCGNLVPDHASIAPPYRGKPLGRCLERSELAGAVNVRVIKVGRTTGLTSATISATDVVNQRVSFGRRKTYTFDHVVEVLWDEAAPPFTLGGDSGSLVVTEDGLRPVGLHFASAPGVGGGHVSFVVPICTIRDKLGATLL